MLVLLLVMLLVVVMLLLVVLVGVVVHVVVVVFVVVLVALPSPCLQQAYYAICKWPCFAAIYKMLEACPSVNSCKFQPRDNTPQEPKDCDFS